MPLLHKKPFTPERPPRDLRQDEEVFLCKATQEIFRDYESFFHRHFLCNSYVWTCSLTGQSGLTYSQATKSEREAQQLLDNFPACYQKAVLELVHHVPRTNVRSLAEEILSYFKERYVTGETIHLAQTTASGAKVLCKVKVAKVIAPDPASPIRMSVISTPPTSVPADSPTVNGVTTSPSSLPLTNGLSESPPDAKPAEPSSPKSFKTPKTPTSRTPLTPNAHISPSAYRYVVEKEEESGSTKITVSTKQLSRPKGQLHPKTLKLFLRNSLHRPNEKYPFKVKDALIREFQLGPSSVNFEPHPSPSPSAKSRKRSLSQASLDSFLSPGSGVKKSRPDSLDTSNKSTKGKRTPQKTRKISVGKSKTPSTGGRKFVKGTPKTPRSQKGRTPRSNHIEALKVLNKAKKFRQLDLKKSVMKKAGLSEEELAELERKAEEERRRWKEVWEEEKRRRREERGEKLRAQQEQKKLERLRMKEMMKPKEDTLCTDSKPLPSPAPVDCKLPAALFGEAVMLLEFLHSFGPLFNIREVIREGITFEKIEKCLISSETDTILFDLVKFLVQAVLAAMEEDNEDTVRVKNVVSQGPDGDGEGEEVEDGVEGEDEVQPLDVKVKTICGSSVVYAQWSWLTQRLQLNQLVVDPYTCSEVLRLHLLACGGYSESANRKRFRCHRRGGYSDGDNPAISLRLRRPDLLTCLSRTSIYDLSAEDKLELFSTLCGQLLTFSVSRDHIEECVGQRKRVRRRMRELQYEEEKKKKESRQKAKEKKTTVNGTAQITIGQNTNQDTDSMVDHQEGGKGGSGGGSGGGGDQDNRQCKPSPMEGPQETEEERKERVEQELDSLWKEAREAECSINLQPLGSDRNHQRYWLFPNLPGLFVEDLGLVLPTAGTPTPHPSTPPTQSTNKVGVARWSCYETEEEMEELMSALDVRGVREKALKETLTQYKSILISNLQQFRNQSKPRPSPPRGQPYNSGDQYLELYLREQILDTEEKIHIGNLGHLRDDRDQWRDCIENSGAAANLNKNEEEKEKEEMEKKEEEEEIMVVERKAIRESPCSISPGSRVNPSVQSLSQALLDVEAGIEEKFLMAPLGMAVDSKKKGLRGSKKDMVKETDVCREQWRTSLLQATSFSQIFLHLTTLERAIMWSKSLMNVRCRICRRKGGDEYMLLCDGCDHGYHTYCLKPPLQQVPEGDWFCYDCSPITPVKPRRRTQRVTFQEIESSESEGEKDENEEEVEEEEEEQDEEEEEEEEEEEGEDEVEEEEVLPAVRSRKRGETRGKRARGGTNRRRSGRLQDKQQQRTKNHTSQRKQKIVLKPTQKPVSKAKKKLNMDSALSSSSSSSCRAESVVSAIIDLRCSRGGRGGGMISREQKGLEMQLCQALWEEIDSHDSSWPFSEPVKKKEYPDYHTIVTQPMDLKTVRSKIKRGDYSCVDGLVADMNLIFSNCQLFHKKHSQIGRAGLCLKKFFEKRVSDLGLKDLQLISSPISTNTRLRSSSRIK